MDRKCPSMIAIIEEYKKNTDYWDDKHSHNNKYGRYKSRAEVLVD